MWRKIEIGAVKCIVINAERSCRIQRSFVTIAELCLHKRTGEPPIAAKSLLVMVIVVILLVLIVVFFVSKNKNEDAISSVSKEMYNDEIIKMPILSATQDRRCP